MFSYCWVSRIFLVYFGQQSFITCLFCKIFFSICFLASHSLDIVFCRTENFDFNELQLIKYFFHGLCLWWYILKVMAVLRSPGFSPTFSPVITALIYLPNWWDLAVKNKQLKMWEIKFSEFHRGSSEGKSMKRVDLPGLAGCIINCLFSVTVT